MQCNNFIYWIMRWPVAPRVELWVVNISGLFNLRGGDINFTPVFFSYCILEMNKIRSVSRLVWVTRCQKIFIVRISRAHVLHSWELTQALIFVLSFNDDVAIGGWFEGDFHPSQIKAELEWIYSRVQLSRRRSYSLHVSVSQKLCMSIVCSVYVHCVLIVCSLYVQDMFTVCFNTIFVSSHMYPENPEGTQVIVGSMNYISIPGADPGIYFWGAKLRSPMESWGRSPNRGREAPEYRGRSPSRGREAPENWGRSPDRGRSPRKIGGGVWIGGSVSPSPENFWKIKLETIHFGAYLKQLFEMTNEIV